MHFKDVKGLFRMDYGVLLGTCLYCAAFAAVTLWRKRGPILARGLLIGGGVTVGVLALIGIGIAFDFDNLFYQFHLISFSNQFWSAEGNMLLLFPGGFWYDMALYVTLFAVGVALVFGTVGVVYLVKHKSQIPNAKA
jgi:integral membrane protein (TIGR01906 family)